MSSIIALPEKHAATKCGKYRTIGLISHAPNILLKVLPMKLESKAESFLEHDQFGFRRNRGTRDAIGVIRFLWECNIEHKEDVCVLC